RGHVRLAAAGGGPWRRLRGLLRLRCLLCLGGLLGLGGLLRLLGLRGRHRGLATLVAGTRLLVDLGGVGGGLLLRCGLLGGGLLGGCGVTATLALLTDDREDGADLDGLVLGDAHLEQGAGGRGGGRGGDVYVRSR